MTQEELIKFQQDLQRLPVPVELLLHEKENDPLSQNLVHFAKGLGEISGGKITLTKKEGASPFPGLPALTVACEDRHNIHYCAVPDGHEFPPFIQALTFVAQGYAPLSPQNRESLANLSSPRELWVLVSPHCTHCPIIVETVLRLASTNPLISACILDVHYVQGLANEYGIKSVPATIINKEIVFIGQVTEEKVAELLAGKGAPNYEREVMRSMIELGHISKAAGFISSGRGWDAILALFEEGDLSMRMGVLVVFEEALEKNPGSLKGIVPRLIDLLPHEDHRIRGDIADLLGKIGDPRAIPHLKKLTADPDPDVVDSAVGALEMIKSARPR